MNSPINTTDSDLPASDRVTSRNSRFWQRFLLVQGIAWIGGIGILGSSIGWTVDQKPTSASIDSSIPESLPKAAPVERTPSSRRRVAQSGERLRSRLRPKTASISPDPSNTFIDSTNYNLGATRRRRSPSRTYDAPSTVVLTERSTGCRRVMSGGELLGRNCGGAVARSRTRVRNSVGSGDRIANNLPRSSRNNRLAQPSEIGRISRRSQIARSQRSFQREQIEQPSQTARVSSRRSQIARIQDSSEIIRSQRPSQIARSRRSSQIPIDYVPVSSQSDRLASTSPISSFRRRSQTAWRSRRPVASVAAVGPLKLGSASSNGIRVQRWNGMNSPNPSSEKTASQPIPPWPGVNYSHTIQTQESPRTSSLPIIFPLPIPAQITSVFGWRIHPISGDMRFHAGTDLGAPMGTPVLAAYAGKVALANALGGYGLTVILQHYNGTKETRYAHLSEIFVQAGDVVEQGTVIGRVGNTGNSTGPHLHFEVREQTSDGWIATDPGIQLEFGLAQLTKAFQVAQSPKPDKADLPKVKVQKIQPDNAKLPEIIIPGTQPYIADPSTGG